MLLSFSVSNFGSFKEKATFSMFPGKISKQHENHVLGCTQFKALKGAALYGANASGKSNFVKAISALRAVVAGVPTRDLLLSQFKLDN
jgi:AAA15 family ATPase/GTPase